MSSDFPVPVLTRRWTWLGAGFLEWSLLDNNVTFCRIREQISVLSPTSHANARQLLSLIAVGTFVLPAIVGSTWRIPCLTNTP